MRDRTDDERRQEMRVAFVNALVNHGYTLKAMDEDGDMYFYADNGSAVTVGNRNALCLASELEQIGNHEWMTCSVMLWFKDMSFAGDGDRYYSGDGEWGFDLATGHRAWNNYIAREEA